MSKTVKYIAIMLISFFLMAMSSFLKSGYISEFLSDNLFLICIAIFAVHASTSVILISQLNILNKSEKIDFSPTLKSIKDSFIEEGVIIFFVIIASIVSKSSLDFFSKEAVRMGIIFIQMSLVFTQLWIIYDILIAILNSFNFTASSHKPKSG